ncbi:hypothetical protein [Variovorax sp. LjRoot175]|uniref:hypothetical protein n=1 Tax=Variovorax sp. LjRoot175 TaxID=3342276 RepID=UPI003F51524F
MAGPEQRDLCFGAGGLNDDHVGRKLSAGSTFRRPAAAAALRRKPLFATFAVAKAGPRSLSQNPARKFGSQGIHVAHGHLRPSC